MAIKWMEAALARVRGMHVKQLSDIHVSFNVAGHATVRLDFLVPIAGIDINTMPEIDKFGAALLYIAQHTDALQAIDPPERHNDFPVE